MFQNVLASVNYFSPDFKMKIVPQFSQGKIPVVVEATVKSEKTLKSTVKKASAKKSSAAQPTTKNSVPKTTPKTKTVNQPSEKQEVSEVVKTKSTPSRKENSVTKSALVDTKPKTFSDLPWNQDLLQNIYRQAPEETRYDMRLANKEVWSKVPGVQKPPNALLEEIKAIVKFSNSAVPTTDDADRVSIRTKKLFSTPNSQR